MNSKHYARALALARRKAPKWDRVFGLLQKAANSGDPRAAYALGTWHLHGRHVSRDVERGVRLIAQAAQKGVADAQFDLAVSYECGTGVRASKRLAALNYLRAALGDDVDAWFEVGRCFYYGIGFGRDRAVAKVLLDFHKKLTTSKRRLQRKPRRRTRRTTTG